MRWLKLLVSISMVVGTLWAGQVYGGDEEVARSLNDEHGCMACHAADTRLVGPNHIEIAQRYDESDVPELVSKVREGGSGNWGSMPMIPHSHVNEEDIETIVRWILTADNKP